MTAAISIPPIFGELVVWGARGWGARRGGRAVEVLIEPRGWDSYPGVRSGPVIGDGPPGGERPFGGLIPKHERPFGVKDFFEQVFATNACSC